MTTPCSCSLHYDHAGVGYVLTGDDDISGHDLDKVRNPVTGGLEIGCRLSSISPRPIPRFPFGRRRAHVLARQARQGHHQRRRTGRDLFDQALPHGHGPPDSRHARQNLASA